MKIKVALLALSVCTAFAGCASRSSVQVQVPNSYSYHDNPDARTTYIRFYKKGYHAGLERQLLRIDNNGDIYLFRMDAQEDLFPADKPDKNPATPSDPIIKAKIEGFNTGFEDGLNAGSSVKVSR